MRSWLPVLLGLVGALLLGVWFWPAPVEVPKPVALLPPVPEEPAPAIPPVSERPPIDWDQRRSDTQQIWGEALHAAATVEFAVLLPVEREQASSALKTYTAAVVLVKGKMATRSVPALKGLAVIKKHRETLHAELEGLLGEDVDAVRARLNERVYGGAW